MSKPDLLLIAPIYPPTMAQLDAAYTVHRYWESKDKDALVTSLKDKCEAAATSGHAGIGANVIRALPKLRMVSCFGVGYDGVDIAAIKAAGIKVSNTPDVLNECVADTSMMLVLATVRRAIFNDRFVRAGQWLAGNAPLTDKVWGVRCSPNMPTGMCLATRKSPTTICARMTSACDTVSCRVSRFM